MAALPQVSLLLGRRPVRNYVVTEALEYWTGKAKGRLPRRDDIQPEEIPHLLPYVFLVDVAHDPIGFRYRLVGTGICLWALKDFTGATLDEREYGPRWRRVFDDYCQVVESRAPRYARLSAPWPGREYLMYERIAAPLSSDGETIDMLFGALYLTEYA